LLGKGAAIACEPRLDLPWHIGSDRYRTTCVAHQASAGDRPTCLASFALLLEPFMK
jgi:hypothetical protein